MPPCDSAPKKRHHVADRETSQSANAAMQPNIIVIIADQWRGQAFGYAGDPNVHTPNIDRLETESTNFTQAVAGLPVCSPSRASFLTGQRPLTHGVFINDVSLDPDATTLPKVLKDAGYDTGAIGKWHVDGRGRSGFIPPERRQGFDYWKVLECTHRYSESAYYADGPEELLWDGYDAIAQTDDARRYIEQRATSERPFLLWLSWGPPHNPYETAPPEYRAMYPPENIELAPSVPSEYHDQARQDLAGYYAHCTALDDCLGALLETVETAGLADSTIVLFTSDHGDMLRSHGLIRKQKPYEESIHVPLLLRLPSALEISPARVHGAINTEDLMPTLLGLCGIPVPPSTDGLDFTDYLYGGEDPSAGVALIQSVAPFGEFAHRSGGREFRGIRTRHHTYARDLDGPWLLFDNEADPWQMNNLVGRPEHVELEAALESSLQARLVSVGDAFEPAAAYLTAWGYEVDQRGTPLPRG